MLPPALAGQLRGRKVLATDLDGTLLRPDLTVSETTRRALREVMDAGVHVVFVTGRPPRWMRAVAQETGHAGTAICANGAVLIDLAAEQVIARTAIDRAAALTVVRGLRDRFGSDVHFAVERVAVAAMPLGGSPDEFALEARYRGSLPVPDFAPRLPLDDLLALPDLVKLLARLDGGAAQDFLQSAIELSAGRLEVTHSTNHVLLEFGPRGVTKATALAELVASFGLSRDDVVAVGDMPNDLHMLEWAGIGLAVAEGHDTVLSTADHVIPGPSDDGIAQICHAMTS